MRKYFSDQALVLKRHNYHEADRVLIAFTKNHGKIACIAKGVRRGNSKKAPHIEPLTHTKLYFISTRGLPLVTQAETINNFTNLKNNLQSIRLAFHLSEIIDKMLPENQAHQHVFSDFLKTLQFLDDSNFETETKQELAVTQFQLSLLQKLGFGLPAFQDQQAVVDYIENIIDRRLVAREKLS